MSLKEKLLSSFIAFENQISMESNLMANLRGEAIKVFENEGFPTKKMRTGSILR
jgi:Fe-S cluster assembly protein SufD